MLKIQHFAAEDMKSCSEFIEKHPPRGKGGMSATPNGVYIYYEEGEPTSKQEILTRLTEMLRDEADKLIIALPDSKIHEVNQKEMDRFLSDITKQIEQHVATQPSKKEQPAEWRGWKTQLEEMENAKKQIEQNRQTGENMRLMNDNTIKTHRSKIRALKALIQEVEDGLDIFENPSK